MFQENDPFVVSTHGPHRTSCAWSDNDARVGPVTCNCCLERLEAKKWIKNNLSLDIKFSRFGLHLEGCALFREPSIENTTLGNSHVCTCTIDVVRALSNKFEQETSKTDRVMSSTVLPLNNELGMTSGASKDDVALKSLVPKPFSRVQSNANRMKLQVYVDPNRNDLYFLRRLPENMKKSEDIFLTKNDLHDSGLFLTSRSPINAEMHQLMSAMKDFFPRGRQTDRNRFNVGINVKDKLRYLLETVDLAIDSIPT